MSHPFQWQLKFPSVNAWPKWKRNFDIVQKYEFTKYLPSKTQVTIFKKNLQGVLHNKFTLVNMIKRHLEDPKKDLKKNWQNGCFSEFC